MERDPSLSSNDDNVTRIIMQSRALCAVCNSPAIGRNFDAMTCLSCKAFFRRNAYNNHLVFTCRIASSCEITPTTRRHCSACRLKKCFQRGMKKELIRSLAAINQATSAVIMARPHYQPSGVTTMDLLPQNDHSALSFDDWKLLTNIRNAYDQYCVQKFIESHELIPLIPPPQPYRARIKLQRLIDLRYKYTFVIASFLKRILQFDTFGISSENHFQYMKTSVQCITTVNTSELIKSKIVEGSPWKHDQLALQSLLTGEFIQRAEQLLNSFQGFLPYDPVLIKLWVIILALSSQTLPLSKKDEYNSSDFDPVPSNLLASQNYYVALFWKYATYRLGYNDTVNFSVRFIQTFLRRQVFEADMMEILRNRDDYAQLVQLTQMNLRI